MGVGGAVGGGVVAVGGTGVGVGGTDVGVGGTGVAVSGTGVCVAVGIAVGSLFAQAATRLGTTIAATIKRVTRPT